MLINNIFQKIKSKFNITKTLYMQILVYVSFLIIIIIILMDLTFYYQSSKVIKKDAEQSTRQLVNQVGRNIEYYTDYVEDISHILNNDATIKNSLIYKEEESKGTELISAIMKTRTDIVSMFVFGENDVILSAKDSDKIKESINIKEMDWYKKAIIAEGKPIFSSSHVQNYIEDKYDWVVSLSKAIYDDNRELIGVTLIDINYKVFTDICEKVQFGDKGYAFIIDGKGRMIYHPKQQLVYSNIINENIEKILSINSSFEEKVEDGTRIVTISPELSTGWKLVGVTYMDDILIQKNDLIRTIFIITIICLILGTLISMRISTSISTPIYKLEKIMKRVENGELDIDINVNGKYEIARLYATFKVMVKRINSLLSEIEKDQTKLRKSELKALQAQINPHFLYNALDTIIWAAELDEKDKVINMTSALSKYFRLSLSKGKEVISILQEVEHVKSYLTIQKIRYEDKLSYEIDVDKEIVLGSILKIILQPLVENSIYHGIKNLPNGGTVKISGRREGEDVVLKVSDNGTGIEASKLKDILSKKIHGNDEKKLGGVAIINVNERIQLYYGEQYGLSYKSEVGVGTEVEIRIPMLDSCGGKYEKNN